MKLITQIVLDFEKEITKLPDGFYNTFRYTTTGRNYTHPITLAILSKIISRIADVQYIAIDLKLNEGNAKFQPDLVAMTSLEPFQPLLFLDYESPNSSDMRIPTKNIDTYIAWSKAYSRRIPYIIITTLPNRKTESWQLRYTSEGYPNEAFSNRRKDIFENPFQFWYSQYRKVLKSMNLSKIYFININGKRVKRVTL